MLRAVSVFAVFLVLIAGVNAGTSITKDGWDVKIKSPYEFDYKIDGNELVLTLFVNAVLKNSCEEILKKVVPGDCPNCYDVLVSKGRPPADRMCLQVIKEVNAVHLNIPLNASERKVSIVVRGGFKGVQKRAYDSVEEEFNKCLEDPDSCKLELGKEFKVNVVRERVRGVLSICEELKRKIEECLNDESCDVSELEEEFKRRCSGKEGAKAKKTIKIIGEEMLKKEGGKTISVASGKEVVALDDALSKIRATVKEIEVEDDGRAPLYRAKGFEEGKLLGIIPFKIQVSMEIDATTGEVKRVQRPWWSFLVFRV